MKNHRFGQNLTLFEQTGMFLRFDQLFTKKLQKVPHFAKTMKNLRVGQNLQLFEQTRMFRCFHELLSKKFEKVPHFEKKPRKLMDLAKTCNFSNKLACFRVLIKFSGKRCKKCLISLKTMKNNRFGQNLTLFEKTGMFFCFDELFNKKLQKVPDFAKNHKKSSIWPKLATFRTNWHVFVF